MKSNKFTNESINEIQSLNDALYDEFMIEKMEERLETSALFSGESLIALQSSDLPDVERCSFCSPICDFNNCVIY